MKWHEKYRRLLLIGSMLLLLLTWLASPALAHAEDIGGYAPGELFNQGNAHQTAGRTGKAILSYERALLLDPGADDIEHNLAAMRSAAGLSTPEGHALGRVRTPDNLNVFEIGTDYVLGVIRDDLEVERVRLHAMSASADVPLESGS